MKFELITSKIANQFFFVSNLSEWHFSCRADYNKKWLLMTSSLNSKEKEALEKFRDIIRKYDFNIKDGKRMYLGKYFYSASLLATAWQKIQRATSPKEYKEIKNTFKIFSPRFELIWKLIPDSEKERRVKLLHLTIKEARNQSIIKYLNSLFRITPKRIKIIIIFSPLGSTASAAGSANLDGNSLTLEVPMLKGGTLELDVSIGILFHEIIHLILDKTEIRKTIEKIIKEFKLPQRITKIPFPSMLVLINEIIVNSLAPYGYLTRKFYGKEFSRRIFSIRNLERIEKEYKKFLSGTIRNPYLLIKYFTWKLYPVISRMLKINPQIDEDFIRKVVSVLKIKRSP